MTGGRSLLARVAHKLGLKRGPGRAQAQPAGRGPLRRRVKELSKQVSKLNDRVGYLEAELLEARSQGRRVGELSDLVTELLANEASRRDPEFQRIVDKYASERRG